MPFPPYTDGNWTVCPNNPRKVVSDSLDGLDPLTGENVVGGAVAGPKAEANARMFAAGPDLLAALKAILDAVEVNDDWAVSKALDAIAKAEGRS